MSFESGDDNDDEEEFKDAYEFLSKSLVPSGGSEESNENIQN